MIRFQNCTNGWHNALPVGNGVMGAMAYYHGDGLSFAMNHYEVYYRNLGRYGAVQPESMEAGDGRGCEGPRYPELERLADEMYRDCRVEPVNQYFESLHHSMRDYGGLYRGASHPPTGEMTLCFANGFKDPEESCLQLDIGKAEVSFRAQCGAEWVEVASYIAAEDHYLVTDVTQSVPGAVESIVLKYPQRRLHEGYDCKLNQLDEHTAYYTVSFYPPGMEPGKHPPYSFRVAVKLTGEGASARFGENEIRLSLSGAARSFHIVTAVLCGTDGGSLEDPALPRLPDTQGALSLLRQRHDARWNAFWSKSAVRLPDRFLETLWYMSLYTLECSSGKGGRMAEQASGLSGLWDIRQPTVWGSMWYWDVNIQASYWPVFTANHPELGKVFCDGFLSYGRLAERFARDVYGVEGWAADYPHALYYCIAPWCAQYLWWYYVYSGDEEFLREKAYPCFRRIIRFIRNIVKYDERSGEYYFYPDVSPEQGPLTRNSVSTLASVKYLLRCAIRAGECLGEAKETLDGDRDLLARLSGYPLSQSGGKCRLKDSEHAPDGLWLRHPSLLMPIYPIGEIGLNSDEETRAIGINTLDYAAENTETGVFGFGWLSCAASRLGDGAKALRLLYEKGIDYVLRSNGLGYEETDRWINYCCIDQQPLYYPPMMEASGEIAAAVNEMLLQSHDGVIAVFPAVPDGRRETERELGVYEHERQDRFLRYEGWERCRFDSLLAQGGFEVSGEWRNHKTAWIRVKSLYGNTARVRCCFEQPKLFSVEPYGRVKLACAVHDGVLAFPTEKGRSYFICDGGEPGALPEWDDAAANAALVHEAHTHRRVFLGEDENTEFTKRLDAFLFEYCMGNTGRSPMTVYKFDFGLPEHTLAKDYSGVAHRQSITTERQMALAQTFIRIERGTAYRTVLGYGFRDAPDLQSEDRQGPDDIRRDFIAGTEPAAFCVELPKGKYDLLVISHDMDMPFCTGIELQPAGLRYKGKALRKGRCQSSTLPAVMEEDGILKLVFFTEPGFRWVVNAVIINKEYSLI